MDYSTVADDFFVNLDLQTTLALPESRETILHFCETVQKEFAEMTSFYQRDTGQYVLEGDRDGGSYQWMELQAHQLSAGHFNPPDIESAYALHSWLLERVVYFLGISGLDVEALDLLFGFNMDFVGNRDEIVAEALLAGSPLSALVSEHPVRTVEFEPNFVVAVSEDCYTQARLSVETRCDSYQIRTGKYSDEPISLYFTIRRYPSAGSVLDLQESFRRQCELAEDMLERVVIPNVAEPIAALILSGR